MATMISLAALLVWLVICVVAAQVMSIIHPGSTGEPLDYAILAVMIGGCIAVPLGTFVFLVARPAQR